MPTWGCILETFLSTLLPDTFFSSIFCCPPLSHGLNSLQRPRGERESESLGSGSDEKQMAPQMAVLTLKTLGGGSDLAEFLISLGQLLTHPMW